MGKKNSRNTSTNTTSSATMSNDQNTEMNTSAPGSDGVIDSENQKLNTGAPEGGEQGGQTEARTEEGGADDSTATEGADLSITNGQGETETISAERLAAATVTEITDTQDGAADDKIMVLGAGTVADVAKLMASADEQVVVVNDPYAGLNNQAKLAFQTLEEYFKQMAPNRPTTPEAGARQQILLYRSICSIINDSGDSFQEAFSRLLALFQQHKDGVFHEINAMRFVERVNLSLDDQRGLQRLVHLLRLMAPAQSRGIAKKQVDFEAALKYGLTEVGRQRVLSYFQV